MRANLGHSVRKFKQKTKITTIDISCQFLLQNNDVTNILHQRSWGHNQTPKVASDMQRIAYSSSFIPCKNQWELLMPWIVFAVNRYECFMENKNIRRFCGCKPFKKTTTLSLIKILLALIKEHEGSEWTPKYTVYQKIKRLINYGKNYWNNTMCNL